MRGALALSRFCTLLLLAFALGGMGASTASADFGATGERDAASNAVVAATVAFGSEWLAARGITQCATSAAGFVHMGDDLGTYTDESGHEQDYGGAALGCKVWILARTIRLANSRAAWAVEDLCDATVHELAHTGGVSHKTMADTGIELEWQAACDGFAARVEMTARVQGKEARRARRAKGRRATK